MRLVVADASAIAEYLLQTARGIQLRRVVEDPEQDLHIPALCDVEIAAVLRRAMRTGRLTEGRAREAIGDYVELPLTRHGHVDLLPRILALRSNFTAYDAAYVALAEQLGAALVTADQPLAKAVAAQLDIAVQGV